MSREISEGQFLVEAGGIYPLWKTKYAEYNFSILDNEFIVDPGNKMMGKSVIEEEYLIEAREHKNFIAIVYPDGHDSFTIDPYYEQVINVDFSLEQYKGIPNSYFFINRQFILLGENGSKEFIHTMEKTYAFETPSELKIYTDNINQMGRLHYDECNFVGAAPSFVNLSDGYGNFIICRPHICNFVKVKIESSDTKLLNCTVDDFLSRKNWEI